MPHPFLMRPARRAALALAASMATACGDSKPPSIPDPPQVQLTVPEGTLASTSLKVVVTVSGCETVSSLVINDRDTPIKTFPYSAGTATLELQAADLPYRTAGLAANLSLVAEATCDDGRKNRSAPQPASFLPVARRVVNTQNGQQVVTDFFIAEGSGANVTFLGCGNPGTGLPTLYRVDANGQVKGEWQMPFACTADTAITERHPVTGKRWVWTPGEGAMAVDANNLTITSRTRSDLRPTLLTVMPQGDALIVTRIHEIIRLSHTPSSPSGNVGTERLLFDEVEPLLTPPMVIGDRVRYAHMGVANDPSQTAVQVSDVDAEGRAEFPIHNLLDRYTLRTISRSDGTPVGAFNADGSILYLGSQLAGGQSHVQSCSATRGECEGGNQAWTSTALPAPLSGLIFHGPTSRVVARGKQRVWMLDSNSGVMRNKDSRSVDANGALNVLQVLPARPPATALFLLTGPARTAGGLATYPQEIVAIEQTSSGEARELFRYQEPVSLSAAVDEEGRVWLRTGLNLVQTLPMGDYRRYRP
ncbi:hypothetical protein HPC49_38000 [Pyxidicoccus fallax]|uniref:Lipoprotein n=1 Tax=Pyxidicoccus fallax TaxID=394095 RepID=A0A848LXP3_9BACT|nr:hypothetical protein [Pyxidicoccus fallax]NMO22312.1 hypothetical protein [Pyxidicoccus fallax]NPC83995.1 hypothetical protein [Pyxidicoccus fallax]